MVQKHLASVLLSLGAICPFVVQADQPAARNQSNMQKKMAPQFEMGDPIEAGQPGQSGYVPAAYNYPAALRAPNQDWDVYITADFIWWKPHQDNMFSGIATNQATPANVTSGFSGDLALNNDIAFTTKPGYKPGFKVGLGWNTGSWDNWTVYGQYTWYHTGNGKDEADDCGDCGCAEQVALPPSCACPGFLYASGVESKWKIDLDIADLTVGRPGYQGKRLIVNPFFGLRATWLKQHWNVDYSTGLDADNVAQGAYFTKSNWSSWRLGPRLGVDGSWLLGCGFRFIGNASASLLYTRYTKLNYSSSIPNYVTENSDDGGEAALANPTSWKTYKNYGTVRPNFEIDAGFGWGTYIGDEFHLDFAATYDFNVFWNENMGASAANWAVSSVDAAPGNLYLHGLTIKARFDF